MQTENLPESEASHTHEAVRMHRGAFKKTEEKDAYTLIANKETYQVVSKNLNFGDDLNKNANYVYIQKYSTKNHPFLTVSDKQFLQTSLAKKIRAMEGLTFPNLLQNIMNIVSDSLQEPEKSEEERIIAPNFFKNTVNIDYNIIKGILSLLDLVDEGTGGQYTHHMLLIAMAVRYAVKRGKLPKTTQVRCIRGQHVNQGTEHGWCAVYIPEGRDKKFWFLDLINRSNLLPIYGSSYPTTNTRGGRDSDYALEDYQFFYKKISMWIFKEFNSITKMQSGAGVAPHKVQNHPPTKSNPVIPDAIIPHAPRTRVHSSQTASRPASSSEGHSEAAPENTASQLKTYRIIFAATALLALTFNTIDFIDSFLPWPALLGVNLVLLFALVALRVCQSKIETCLTACVGSPSSANAVSQGHRPAQSKRMSRAENVVNFELSHFYPAR